MPHPFEIADKNITGLNQIDALAFFRRLLWAEAAFTGVAQRLVCVPQCINTSDGGLDARIEESVHPSRDDIIPKGVSGFQIKATDLKPRKCKEEICDKSDPNSLAPEIRRLLEQGGTYVLVLFADITGTLRNRRQQALLDEFRRLGYKDAKVRLYTSTHLLGFTNRFPSVVLSLKPDYKRCLDYESWGGKNSDVCQPVEFVQDEKRSEIITRLRGSLRARDGRCPVVRVSGLSGLGKTRMVYEALSEPDLRNRTIYSYHEHFAGSEALSALQRDDQVSAILVIDECDAQGHDFYIRQFGSRCDRLALITISPDITRTPSDQIVLSPISEDCIKLLIRNENPEMPADATGRIARFSEGYPKIAMLLSENILASRGESPEDLLHINDDNLIERMIAGRLDPASSTVLDIKRVLTGFSIFKKVGWKGSLNEEAKWVASKFGFVSDAKWNRFAEIIKEQRQRRVLQGEHYLYITPFPLAVHLTHDWLETQGDFLDFEDFFADAPRDLLPRFLERIPYMGGSIAGMKAVERLLGDTGPFADGRLLRTASGAELFRYLTEAAPDIALWCLKNTIGRWTRQALLEFTEGRQDIVWSLERIAVWSELFQDAARLLLALAEAETDDIYSNNASGIFCGLFAFGLGPVSSTEAPPETRISILAEALRSQSKGKRLLALRACDVGLNTGPYTRMVGREFQGARPNADLWRPKTYGELFDAYREIWLLLLQEMNSPDDEIRKKALNVIMGRGRRLSWMANLAPMVIDTFEQLSKLPWLDSRKLVEVIEQIIHYDRKYLSPESFERWVKLRDQIVGCDFDSLVKRYVGMDLLVDRFGNEGNEEEKLNAILDDLAGKVMNSPELLTPHVSWLLSADATNGHRFGYALGKADSEFLLLKSFIETAGKKQDATAFFLGGYLKRIFETNRDLWEHTLSKVSQEPRLRKLLPELTWRSGKTDTAMARILAAAKAGAFEIGQLRLFSYGGMITSLSENAFRKWAHFLMQEPTGIGAEILLDLYIFYYIYRQKSKILPRQLTLDLLCHEVFFGGMNRLKARENIEYRWKEVAEKLIKQHPDAAKRLRKVLLEAFGMENSIVKSHYSGATEVLTIIAQLYPAETWREIANYLSFSRDTRNFHLELWLKGETGSLDKQAGTLWLFDPSHLWKWIDEDAEKRAKHAAGFVPPHLFHSNDKRCYVRELLVRYGDRDDVKGALAANFWSEGWSGPDSLHYMGRIAALEHFNKGECNSRVHTWVEDYINSLRKDVERAQVEEERDE